MRQATWVFFLLAVLCSCHGGQSEMKHSRGPHTRSSTEAVTVTGDTPAAPLAAVITGIEHSGTTLLSEIVKSHSNISGGFECGIFLGNLATFGRVKPFSDWLKEGDLHFGLPSSYLQAVASMTYAQAVQYINTHKGTKDDSVRQVAIRSGSMYVDKTPRYIYDLPDILGKLHSAAAPVPVPVFVMMKQFDDILESWVMKQHIQYERFLRNVKKCVKALEGLVAGHHYRQHVYVISYNDLLRDEAEVSRWLMRVLRRYHPSLPVETLSSQRYVCEAERDCEEHEVVKPASAKHYRPEVVPFEALNASMRMSINATREIYDNLLRSLKVNLTYV
mmetsp:Transcript_6003/g.11445  ORF Transcript_6003/g.11445 Transcript_6003/m.11445 type:complete len:332 (+) Transcript_6003:179-1174(+)